MFHIRLRQQLRMKNMTQRQLAERVGLTETTISRYVNGTRTPDIFDFRKIVVALETSADFMLNIKYVECNLCGKTVLTQNAECVKNGYLCKNCFKYINEYLASRGLPHKEVANCERQ